MRINWYYFSQKSFFPLTRGFPKNRKIFEFRNVMKADEEFFPKKVFILLESKVEGRKVYG